MSRYAIADAALRDLKVIAAELAGISEALAQRYEQKFQARFHLLARFPLQCAVDERLDGRVRVALVRPYQVLYQPTDGGVQVLRVIHHARDLRAALDE
ncbi:MAG: type II toxin-antitoxin system RelE/ParE family toxin [Planctomycetota bacterium]